MSMQTNFLVQAFAATGEHLRGAVPHHGREGIWRIESCFETEQPRSTSAVLASGMASDLNKIGEGELAGKSATR